MCATLLLLMPFLLAMVFSSDIGTTLSAFFVYNALAYAWLGPTIRLIQQLSLGNAHSQSPCAEPLEYSSVSASECRSSAGSATS